MFRPHKVIIRPSKKTDPTAVLFFTALWDLKCLQVFVAECKVHKFVYMNLCDGFDVKVRAYSEMMVWLVSRHQRGKTSVPCIIDK